MPSNMNLYIRHKFVTNIHKMSDCQSMEISFAQRNTLTFERITLSKNELSVALN